MADERKDANANAGGGGGLLDLERELTCSICTDILYQPLTLLDCLHTFCGGCSKEWFAFQAAAAAANRRTARPYTCPSCRESVRGTKADWRLTALLEGFLRANPDRGKTGEEKEEMNQQYKPGDEVLPPVRIERDEDDSEDERILADVRELSMANVDPETARRRAERSARERQRRRQEQRSSPRTSRRPEESSRHERAGRWAAQQAELQRSGEERQVEHQPSLRSLLSGSEITSDDVQEEILQSIYSEGLLTGIDIDNLTLQQEEELTERIAEAYRRRQRNRERSRNRERPSHERAAPSSNSPRLSNNQGGSPATSQAELSPPQQHHTPRSRPPISRPHLFEPTTSGAERSERRSASSTSHRRQQSSTDNTHNSGVSTAARSATDLSLSPESREQHQRPRASSSNTRSTTDPTNMRHEAQRVRNMSDSLRPGSMEGPPAAGSRDRESRRRETGPSTGSTAVLQPPNGVPSIQSIRPAPSTSAFAPEVVTNTSSLPSISCSRCQRSHIETSLHYNCSTCQDGNFNLCLQCYRDGQGCNHWFGFGYNTWESWTRTPAPPEGWPRGYERPHILTVRRYRSTDHSAPADGGRNPPANANNLEQGAFCELCLSSANTGYWYCQYCLDGAWGFCDTCVHQGKHCTHPLVPLTHLSTLSNASHDPSKLDFFPAPHLKQHSYILRPELTVYCDVCSSPITAKDTRFHCYKCSDGDYDICNPCYHKLVATGKISHANGPNGWRRCLQNHRMAVVGYQVTQHGGSPNRITYQGPVGGWRLKDEGDTRAPPPANISDTGVKLSATWNRFPGEGVADELVFPRNAIVSEVEDRNEDWALGVYAGSVGLFPKNHTMRN